MSQGTSHVLYDILANCLLRALPSQHNVPIEHEARQVSADDFRKFTYILASDEANLRNLERMKPKDSTALVRLWGSYDDNKAIADPYYGGMVRTSDAHLNAECS